MVAAVCQGFAAEAAQSDFSAEVKTNRGLVEIRFKGAKLLSYAFAADQFKPYVRELYSLGGHNVLRDAPADHLHHHGLMYAIRINGVNFWEEGDLPGHQRHVNLTGPQMGRAGNGLPQASFTELIHWVPHGEHTRTNTAPVAFLVELRTLTLTVDESKQEVALGWHQEFEAGAGANRVRLHGSDYNGIGLRLPEAWDKVARQQTSEGTAPANGGKPGAVPARWGAVASTGDEGAIQVLLFARPQGHAGKNAFFTMTEPFTYLSATQSLDKMPLEYRAGDRFRLDYLVLVYPFARTGAQIEQRYQSWAKDLTVTSQDPAETLNKR